MKQQIKRLTDWLKKSFNVTWKTAIVVIAILFTLNFFGCYWSKVRGRFSDSTYVKCELSPTIVVKYDFSKGTYCTFNKVTEKVVTPDLKWISDTPMRDLLTVYCDMHDQRGFINVITGKIEIPAQYRRAWVFSEGLAAVVCDDDSLRFINHKNEKVMDIAFEYNHNEDYVFRNGYCVMANDPQYGEYSDRYGVIDREGQWVLPQEYYSIGEMEGTGYYRIRVRAGERVFSGMTDKDFNIMFEPRYNSISFYDDWKSVFISENGTKRQVSLDGRIIEPFVIDETSELRYDLPGNVRYSDEGCEIPRECVSEKYIKFLVDGYCGVMDRRSGRVILPALYHDVAMVSENLFSVTIDSDGESLLFDGFGRQIK